MTTVLSAPGDRRCDGTCHDAKSSLCRCICGGALHGRGAAHALEAAAKVAEDITDPWIRIHRREISRELRRQERRRVPAGAPS